MSEEPHLDQQIDSYLRHLKVERDLAENTLLAYSRDLTDFAAFVIHQGLTSAQAISSADIAGWVRDLHHNGLKARSQARMLVAVRGLFRYLVRQEILEEDPAQLVDLPKVGSHLPELVDYEEFLLLMQAAQKSPRDQALVILLYGAGLRVSEVINLEVGSVYLDSGLLRVLGKGNKERVVPIGEAIILVLRGYLDQDREKRLKGKVSDMLFPGRSKSGTLSRQAVFLRLRQLARNAGLGRDISPHKLRHGFATDLVRGGADLRSVQMMLGHADLRTTEMYTHVDEKHLRRTYDRTHPRA